MQFPFRHTFPCDPYKHLSNALCRQRRNTVRNTHLNVLSEAVWGSGEQTSTNVFGSQPFKLDGRLPISDRPRASGKVEDPIGAGRWDLAWSQIIQVQLWLTHQQTAARCRWPDTDVNMTCHWWPLTWFKSGCICTKKYCEEILKILSFHLNCTILVI